MRHTNHGRTLRLQSRNGRKRSQDPEIINDLGSLHRNIEIHTHERALTADIGWDRGQFHTPFTIAANCSGVQGDS